MLYQSTFLVQLVVLEGGNGLFLRAANESSKSQNEAKFVRRGSTNQLAEFHKTVRCEIKCSPSTPENPVLAEAREVHDRRSCTHRRKGASIVDVGTILPEILKILDGDTTGLPASICTG